MIEEMLAGAEQIEKEVPYGAYTGPPPAEVKATAEEVVRSIQGAGPRLQPGRFVYQEPKVRVSPRGTIQFVFEKPYGNFSIAVREWDQGGSIGVDRFPKGDLPPDPEIMGSQPIGHVVAEVVAWMAR
jgi:hypothetical protein